eukprot:TRINITY_DN15197_c0_g1_i1.p1 TRINITY_DN15197_c0_g1~~TRINITY_DN15197_c0_g1_i1.p1  ORF type:complete len:157 (-),score=31.55 TRINITY_DN15197_c0_g1_i1:55-525(-)
MVLYELWLSVAPYEQLTPYQVVIEVAHKASRPVIPNLIPSDIQRIMVSCWDTDPKNRPSFDILQSLLQKIRFNKPKTHKPSTNTKIRSASPGWLGNISSSVGIDDRRNINDLETSDYDFNLKRDRTVFGGNQNSDTNSEIKEEEPKEGLDESSIFF